MPIEVILGHVEHRAGRRSHRRRPVQLKAGQLDGQELDVTIQHVEHRIADIPAQRTGATGRRQHVVDHGRGRGLPVGPGDHHPSLGRPVPTGSVQTPSQFDVTPNGQPGLYRGLHHRRRGTESGADDHQVLIGHMTLRCCGRQGPTPGITMALQGVLIVVADRNAQAEAGQPGQRRDHGVAGDPRTAHQNPCSAGQFGDFIRGHGRLVTDRGEPLAIEQCQAQATGDGGQ
ncbi:Uncharacterised protein [Mycobacteroides abscessus subsp. abscessus]|nr:Uncharacterised protein [Mycobacteroides abscessus subsp. abscessus]